MRTLLWLDDIRNPFDENGKWLVFSPIPQPFEVVWVKNYTDFVWWIRMNGMPDAICFDHDLGEEGAEEKTGLDCAKWLIEYCMDNRFKLPAWNVQSANPVGKENINTLLNNFKRHQEK